MALLLWLGSQMSSIWSNISILGVFLTMFALLLDFMKRRKKWSRYPPGPASLPFVGTMFSIDFHNPHHSFGQVHERTSSRRQMRAGIVAARYGHVWKEIRRFALSTLRNFGMGKKSLEERVVEEAGFLCSEIKSKEGKSFDIHILINNAVCNMICNIVFGDRFDYGDKTFKKLSQLFQNSLNEETGFLPQLLNVVPILVRIPGVPQKIFRAQTELMDFIDVVLDKHMKTWDPAYTRDITDVFLKEMEKITSTIQVLLLCLTNPAMLWRSGTSSPWAEQHDPHYSAQQYSLGGKAAEENGFHYGNLRIVTMDLFTAGSETTSTTLRWALLYMLLHPEIQSKVQAEIDRVIGRERPPTMKDQASMPYTNAVIHEVQRYGDIVPVGLPHMTYRDTELQGFFIPKGTTIITNLSSVLKDETIWEKPNEFYPEHFLDAKGQFVKPEAFLPFSAGRRACPGEQLARMELFLFFITLLQKFTFVLAEDQPRPRADGHFALTRSPHPYLLQALPR
ncbi:hypothetical protein DV515_00009025 [Chloebia gouldiae]|uniref:Cytochrome P450 n=1 Tax=Chloebia gouldiae TaxID=44316 RepID=A0A3L8SDW0_CHLGU|nr:hypothetical protein DV515_00009025 [Chloebia gouldiae]